MIPRTPPQPFQLALNLERECITVVLLGSEGCCQSTNLYNYNVSSTYEATNQSVSNPGKTLWDSRETYMGNEGRDTVVIGGATIPNATIGTSFAVFVATLTLVEMAMGWWAEQTRGPP